MMARKDTRRESLTRRRPEQKAKWLDTHLEITRIHKELVLKASGRKEVVLPDERQRRGGRAPPRPVLAASLGANGRRLRHQLRPYHA